MNLQHFSKSIILYSRIKRVRRFKQILSRGNNSSTATTVHHFTHNQSLNLILSSKVLENNNESSNELPRILSPALRIRNDSREELHLPLDTPFFGNNVASFIDSHYELDSNSHFVGGMGENDGGVWFVSDNNDAFDTLDYWEQINDVIKTVTESRHGVPFGLYTSGIVQNKDIVINLKEMVGVTSIEVTLGSGDPHSYSKLIQTRHDMTANSAFGQVCEFIAQASESGFPVTVGVAGGKHAVAGSELARALGAVKVVVYDSVGV